MANMETDRTFRLESFGGTLLLLCNSAWILTHRNQPTDHVSDLFVVLALIGTVIILRAEWKRLKRKSR